MNVVEQEVDVWGYCPQTMEESLVRVEKAGRICYRSEAKIEPGTAKKFVTGILKPTPAHLSVTEHSAIVYRSNALKNPKKFQALLRHNIDSDFIYTRVEDGRVYVFGNYRAWFEFYRSKGIDVSFFDLLDPNAAPNHCELVTIKALIPRFARAVTVKFKTDRAVTHEIVRHRPASYSQESQRYVRNDGEMEFIKPAWFTSSIDDDTSTEAEGIFLEAVDRAETYYHLLRETGMKPQDARVILPNQTATTIVMTAFMEEWDHVFYLRTSQAAYPQIRELMEEARTKMKALGCA